MGVMEKMRKSTGAILWVLIFSFGVLWLLADTQVFDAMQVGPRSMGSVNGEAISMEEYNNQVANYVDQYSQQTGNSMNPETRANLENQAWEDLVATKLIQQKMDDLGITVTNQEVVDMITGDNPIPFIRQQFQREDGTIDRQALQQAIQAPENSQIWITLEQQIRQQRRQQKMSNYVQSAMQVSNYEIEQAFIRANTYADIDYVRFPYADISESELNITDAELRTYYDENRDRYHRNETYRFEYVSFDTRPTSEDTARTINELDELRSDFAAAENDSLFLNRYQSTTSYQDEYINKEDIREIYRPVLDVEVGEVAGPIVDAGTVYIIKKLDETDTQVQFVVLSQDIRADPIETIDRQAEEADDFSFFAEEDGFEQEAERRGMEVQNGFATRGNNFVAGIGESSQVLNFLESAGEGDISAPLELGNQILVVRVNEIVPEGPRPFEEVESQVRTAVINNKRKERTAEQLRELLSANNNLEELATAAEKEVVSVDGLSMNSSTIRGAGREPQVIGAIFGLNEREQSGVIQGNNAAFVIMVTSRRDADLENLDAATRQQLRQQIRQQKSGVFTQVWLEELKAEADITDNRSRVLQQR